MSTFLEKKKQKQDYKWLQGRVFPEQHGQKEPYPS